MKKLLSLVLAILSSFALGQTNTFNTGDKALYPVTYGTVGNCWTSNGAGTIPSWQACSAGGGMTIGGAVSGGTATRILFEGAGPVLSDSANFTWSGTALGLGASGSVGSVVLGNASSGTVTLQTVSGALGSVTLSLPAATDTLTGKATTDTLTNKTLDTAGTGNVFKINGNSFNNTNCDTTHFVRGDGTCQTVSASAALSAITAATGAGSQLSSGNNSGINFGWSLTSDAVTAFKPYSEVVAATGGTVTTGFANQVGASFETLAGSTATAFQLKIRGVIAMQASSTATQIIYAPGTALLPIIGSSQDNTTGVFFGVAGVSSFSLVTGGVEQVRVASGGGGDQTGVRDSNSVGSPSFLGLNNLTTGLGWHGGAHTMSIEDSTDGEWIRFLSRIMQPSRGSADAVGFALNLRKSRGSVAIPTAITTGDVLFTQSGYGFVGATNTYLEATRIESDSTGTITDATSGVGGILRFMTTTQGTDTAVQENLRIFGGSTAPTIQGVAAGLTQNIAAQGSGNNSAGGAMALTAGAGGSSSTGGAGGNITITGGTGNGSAANVGGTAALVGGTPSATGAGGPVNITSGAGGATSGQAGAITISVGSTASSVGSSISITAGNGATGTNGGGNVNITGGTAVSTGTPGEVQINGASGFFDACYMQQPPYVTNVPVTGTSYPIFLANRAYRVKTASVYASSSATTPTVNVIKDTGTNAPGAGTSVLTGAITFSGTANTVVTGTVSSTIATVNIAAGNRLSLTFGGTVGAITGAVVCVGLEPI